MASEREQLAESVAKMSHFKWTRKREKAAIALGQGYTAQEAAEQAGVCRRTIERWKRHTIFSAEVDRLSLMLDIASRAERLRIAMRVLREKGHKTGRDLLDWLKYAQSETDGVRLDLTSLFEAATSLADNGQEGIPGEAQDTGGGEPQL